jgi:predicted DNA-binding protein YlxM (UPF0122 family)
MTQRSKELDKKVDYGLLSSYYGALLTERQRSMLSLFCDEDLTLTEVANQLHVSRQCVGDTLQRAYGRLDQLEASLGLMKRFDILQTSMSACRALIIKAFNSGDKPDHLGQALKILDDYLEEEEQ